MQSVMTYIAYIAGAVFILLGLALMFTDIFHMSQLPSQFKIVMGVVLFLYGLFRVVAALLSVRDKKEMSKATT
jgi:hypothetical protein